MKSATNVVSVSGHRSEPDFPDLLHAVNGPSQRSEAACIDLVRQRDEITHRLGKILRDQEQRIQELTRQLKEAHEHAAKCVKAGEEAIKAAEAAVKDAQERANERVSKAEAIAKEQIEQAEARAAHLEEQLTEVQEMVVREFSTALEAMKGHKQAA